MLIRMSLRFVTVIFFVSLCAICFGQVNTANVTGQVTDANGALVPGATVVLTNSDNALAHTAKSTGEGRFAFGFVLVGNYTLKVSSPGFADSAQRFSLVAGQELDLPIGLAVQTTNATVEVTIDSALVDTTTATLSQTLTATQVNQLPVAHQDWTGLLSLDAGEAKTATAQTSGGAGGFGTGVSINGLPSEGYNLTVDGTNATSNPEYTSYSTYQSPNIINTVNNDAIREVSVSKGVAPATVGNAMGGAINLITKSGGSRVHGSVYWLDELSIYDARNQFLKARPRTDFNEYGGSIGGPLLKAKLFGFISYEGARLSSAAVVSGAVPTPYLDSIAPAVYAPLLALFPTVAQPASPTAITAQYSGTNKQLQNDGNGVARLDYSPNESNSFAVRYIRARPYLLSPALLVSNPRTYVAHTDAVNGTYTHLGKKWTEYGRAGFNQLLLNRIDGDYAIDLDGAGYQFSPGGIIAEFLQRGNFITAEGVVSRVAGGHSIQIGGIFQRQRASRVQLQDSTLTYGSLAGFLANTPTSANLRVYSYPAGTPPFQYTDYQYGVYAQDDWKVSKRLTVNLGVRYDVFTVPYEALGRAFNRDVSAAQPSLGFGFGSFRPENSLYNADDNNVQPRLGFAFQPFGAGDTVIRGSAGVLVEGHNFFSGPVGLFAPSASLPTSTNLTQAEVAAAGIKYPFAGTQYPAVVTSLQAQGYLSTNLAFPALNPNNPDPYSLQYQLGIEQKLAPGLALEMNFVDTRGFREFLYYNKNQPNRVTGVQPVPTFTYFGAYDPIDRSHYDGLQSTLRYRGGSRLQMSAVYTWSHVDSYGNDDLLQESGPQDDNNIKAEWGPAPGDIRNRFVTNGILTVPFDKLWKSQTAAQRLIAQGWQVSGILSAQTGLPVNVYNAISSVYPNDRPNAPTGNPYVGGFKQSATHLYLLAAAFPAVPICPASGAQCTGGTLGRYALRAPGLWNLDASVAKKFKFEYADFQLKADLFNSLNHTNYGGLVSATNLGTFGQLTTATARTMQVGARITF